MMDELIDTDCIPTIKEAGMNSLATTVFKLIEKNKELKKEVEFLKNRLEISRKLQEKPKLYPPESDPYFGEEGEG